MRRFICVHLRISAAALAVLCAGLSATAVSAQPAPAPTAAAPSLDAIVAKNLQAKGGEAKLKAVQSMKMLGKVTIQGMDLSMLITTKRPNMMRQEMQFQDKKIVQGFDGTTAWMINPLMGSEAPQEMTGPRPTWPRTRRTSTDHCWTGRGRATRSNTSAPKMWAAPRPTSSS